MVQGAFTKSNGKLKDKQTCETRNVYRNNLDNFVSVFFLAYANMDFTKMVSVKICKTKR